MKAVRAKLLLRSEGALQHPSGLEPSVLGERQSGTGVGRCGGVGSPVVRLRPRKEPVVPQGVK